VLVQFGDHGVDLGVEVNPQVALPEDEDVVRLEQPVHALLQRLDLVDAGLGDQLRRVPLVDQAVDPFGEAIRAVRQRERCRLT
jgi:hypothetical protein